MGLDRVSSNNIVDGSIDPTDLSDFARTPRDDFMMPEIRSIFKGNSTAAGTDGADITVSGVGATAALTAVTKEMGIASLQIDTPDTIYATVSIDLPATVQALGEVDFRVSSPDWSKVKSLYFRLYETLDHTGGFHIVQPITSGTSDLFGTSYTPWTANTWRTMHTIGSMYAASASPTAWGTTDGNAYKTIGSIQVFLGSVAGQAATVYLDRITAPIWPKSMFSIVGDHLYRGFIDNIYTPFVTRGWRGAGTIFETTGTGIYPGYADFAAAIDAGWDVSTHFRRSDGAVWAATDTATAMANAVQYWRKLAAKNLGRPGWLGDRFYPAVYSNAGYYDSTDFAGVLAANGVLGARGDCSDAIYGFDPLNAKNSIATRSGLSSMIPLHGPYNYHYNALHAGTPEAFSATWQGQLEKMLRWKLSANVYTHNVTAGGSATDITTAFAADLIAWLDANKANITFGTIEDMYALTYGRPGERYVNRTGAWVNRRTGVVMP